MMIFAFFYGWFFVGIGFLVKKYPDTIAGYSTLPPERKKNVDIDGLSSYLKKMLIVAGIGVFVTFAIVRLFASVETSTWAMVAFPIGLLLYAAIFGVRKYGMFRRK